ncbi:PorT family protein [Hymenobacter latericus]|uniref:PorT family protein n=1 Tax=Hymenobacter sp. YIM 151858-1 TaxID=2987688 RepID=UPI0022269433|nr:PorT family protein [Hymenobacter sp. YIM 151858-1]UYZ59085.1 PorT family protein [Hymenobacter sp. YIM 151858-1]
MPVCTINYQPSSWLRLAAAGCGLLLAHASAAQMRWGLQAGPVLSQVRVAGEKDEDTSPLLGWQLGLLAERQLAHRWSAQASLGNINKGYQYRSEQLLYAGTRDEVFIREQGRVSLSYLQAAARVVLVLGKRAPAGWHLYAGGLAGVGTSAHNRYDEERHYASGPLAGTQRYRGVEALTYGYLGSSGGGYGFNFGRRRSADIRPLYLGAEAGVGYRRGRVLGQLGVAPVFSQLLPAHLERYRRHQYYLSSVQLTVAYLYSAASQARQP